jgi:hypothetical protein
MASGLAIWDGTAVLQQGRRKGTKAESIQLNELGKQAIRRVDQRQ